MAAYPSLIIAHSDFMEMPRAYPIVKTGYEAGYAQTRAKTTTAPRQYQLSHRGVTAAEVTTWVTFWEARRGGAEAFDFTDPRTAAVVSCRFKHDAGSPPQIVPIGSANVGFTIGPIMLEEAL
jgi:hypothetical protein